MNNRILFLTLWSVTFIMIHLQIGAQEISKHVYVSEQGLMHYVSDEEGNFIPDFSYAGYQYGEVPIPTVPVVKSIVPIDGDNTMHIQSAIDEISKMPVNGQGFRGALHLGPGLYPVHGTLKIPYNGIVLRGAGSESDLINNTVIRAVGNAPPDRDVIQIGGATGHSWTERLPGNTDVITSKYLPAGIKTLSVGQIDLWKVGDHAVIVHPSTDSWLATINYGDTESDDPWEAGDLDLYYYRRIRAVDTVEHKITLDVPLYDHMARNLSQSIIYQPDRRGIRSNIAVEDLRILIETSGEEDEMHARNAVRLLGVEDCWVRNVAALHFTYAGIDTRLANRVSVINCTAIEPHSQITGARRYNFAVGRWSNNILFQNCFATEGRHSFVSNGASSAAGIVFHKCHSEIDYNLSEGHRRWSQALLYDNLTFTNSESRNVLGLYNRGDFGTGHGWATVQSVAWGVQVPLNRGILIQKPPLRQNYAIGCRGIFSNPAPFNQHPKGVIELPNKSAAIQSLYKKQLEYRLQGRQVLDVPAKLNANRGDSIITLEWMDISSEETEYVVEYSIDGGMNFDTLGRLAPNATSYLVRNFEDYAQEIYFRVYCVGPRGVSPYSNLSVLPQATSLKEYVTLPIKVIPNPVLEDFRILTHAEIAEIKIFDVMGHQILTDLKQGNQISCVSWNSGVYTIAVRSLTGHWGIRRIVKL